MDAPKRKPVGPDIAIAFGRGGAGDDESSSNRDNAGGDSGDDEDGDMAGDADVPADFESAYDEYKNDPSAKTMYAMIQACK